MAGRPRDGFSRATNDRAMLKPFENLLSPPRAMLQGSAVGRPTLALPTAAGAMRAIHVSTARAGTALRGVEARYLDDPAGDYETTDGGW